MTFLEKCVRCNKKRFYIAHRSYKTQKMGKITSNDEICGSCFRKVKLLINSQNI